MKYLIAALGLFVGSAYAATIEVPTDCLTIQCGIDTAQDGDIVVVLPGLYIENLKFNGKNITVISQDGPLTTIIDGGTGIDEASTIAFEDNESPVLDGFTIQGGSGNLRKLVGGNNYMVGGGIMCYASSPTLRNLIVQNNTADVAGGIFFTLCTGLIENSQIINNRAEFSVGGVGFTGEPLYDPITGVMLPHGFPDTVTILPTIQGSLIDSNVAGTHAGGIEIGHLINGVIVGNTITNNSALDTLGNDGQGPGIYLNGVTSWTLVQNNRVENNSVGGNTGSGQIHVKLIGAPIGSMLEPGNPGPVIAGNTVVNGGSASTAGISCDEMSVGRIQLYYNNVWNNALNYFRCAAGETDISVEAW